MKTHAFEFGYGPQVARAFDRPEVLEAASAYREEPTPRNAHALRSALVAAGVPPRRVTESMLRNCCLRRKAGAENYRGTPGRGMP